MHCENFPLYIFSNFTLDVITIDIGILVFHFFVRLYIAILCTIEKKKQARQGIDKKHGALFLDSLPSLISSPFLSLSRQPNSPLSMKLKGCLAKAPHP